MKKTDGGAHVFLVGMLFVGFLIFLFVYNYWQTVANVNYEKIDSAVTSSLLSAAVPNLEKSYASTTGKGLLISSSDYIKSGDVGKLERDPSLEACHDRFLSALKTNLKLDDNMESVNPMIHGAVKVKYLRIYEVKKLITGKYRITQHLYQNGSWVVEKILEGAALPVIKVYATWEDEYKQVTKTSVEAEIEIILYTRANGNQLLEQGTPMEQVTEKVSYKRLVEVTDSFLEEW